MRTSLGRFLKLFYFSPCAGLIVIAEESKEGNHVRVSLYYKYIQFDAFSKIFSLFYCGEADRSIRH